MTTKLPNIILLSLLILLGVGAAFGGAILILSPSGKMFGMPLSILAKSPFKTFLIPGIILFTVIGAVPLMLALALITKPKCRFAQLFNFYKDMHWAWTYCIYMAFTLIIWIQLEMTFLQTVHWLHTFYMFFAIAILFVTLLPQVRSLYKQ